MHKKHNPTLKQIKFSLKRHNFFAHFIFHKIYLSSSFRSVWQKERKICLHFVYLSECLKKEMPSVVTSLEERLKQNAKLHSIKLLMRVLKICLRGGDEGREWRGGEGGGGTEREGEGREGM